MIKKSLLQFAATTKTPTEQKLCCRGERVPNFKCVCPVEAVIRKTSERTSSHSTTNIHIIFIEDANNSGITLTKNMRLVLKEG